MKIKIIAPCVSILKQVDFNLHSVTTLIKENTSYCTSGTSINEIGTVHLKIPYDECESVVRKLLLANCYNSDYFRYTTDGSFIYVTTSYNYYLVITNIYGSLKRYLTNENIHCYVRRIVLKLTVDEVMLNYILSSNILKVVPVDIAIKTFIAPHWWNLSYGNYGNNDNVPEDEGIFLNNCFNAYSNYLKLSNVELLTNSNARTVIVAGFKDDYNEFFRASNTDTAASLVYEMQKIINTI